MKHSSNCIEKSVEHAFCDAILMGRVPDGLLMNDAMVVAVLIHFVVDEFSAAIGSKNLDVAIEFGLELIGKFDQVVGCFALGL